jgi:hypothetical protein
MIMSWSDDEGTDGDVDSDASKHVSVMTGRLESGSESDNEDSDYEKVIVSYGY